MLTTLKEDEIDKISLQQICKIIYIDNNINMINIKQTKKKLITFIRMLQFIYKPNNIEIIYLVQSYYF